MKIVIYLRIGGFVKIRMRREHSLANATQQSFELLSRIEGDYDARYTLDTTFYTRPSNSFGADFVPLLASSEPMAGVYSSGSYSLATKEYEA